MTRRKRVGGKKRKTRRKIKRQYGGALPEDSKKILVDANIIKDGDVNLVKEFVETMIETKHFLKYPLKSKEEMEKEEKEREKRRKKKAKGKKPGFFGRLKGFFTRKKPDEGKEEDEEEEEEIEDFDLKKESEYENNDEGVKSSSRVNKEIQLVTIETDNRDLFTGFFYIKSLPRKRIKFSLIYGKIDELTITIGDDSEVFK